jgi:hypothetical protein
MLHLLVAFLFSQVESPAPVDHSPDLLGDIPHNEQAFGDRNDRMPGLPRRDLESEGTSAIGRQFWL